MLFGGMAHRRAGHVARQVDDLGEARGGRRGARCARPPRARAERPPIPGMPLPTGYGLQVRGPDDESIVLPVCLPPGFELASMVLCPEFLPRERAPARDSPSPPRPRAARPSRLPPAPARARTAPRRGAGARARPCASASAARCSTSSAMTRASAWTRRSAVPWMRPSRGARSARRRHRDAPPLRRRAAEAPRARRARRSAARLHVRSARCSAQSRSHSRVDCSPLRQERSASPRC